VCGLALVSCSSRTDNDGYIVVPQIDDPLKLPYRFVISTTAPFTTEGGGRGDGYMIPIQLGTDRGTGCYIVGNGWRPKTPLTGVVFYSDIKMTEALAHINIRAPRVDDTRAADLDRDGVDEAIVTYVINDSLFLETVDFADKDKLAYRKLLVVGEDLDSNGYWDGKGLICAIEDVNDDGYSELIISTDVGYDLYPRLVNCVDWHNDSILWRFESSGIVGRENTYVVDFPDEPACVIVGVSSKGNRAEAGEMTDQHSYLLAIDRHGGLLWRRETGDVFSGGPIELLDFDADGNPDILASHRLDVVEGTNSEVRHQRGLLRVYDSRGELLFSEELGLDRFAPSLKSFDIDDDGIKEIIVSVSDATLEIRDQQMQIIRKCRFPACANILDCRDFLGRGDKQFLIYGRDRKAWLTDLEFRPLAQYPEDLVASRTQVYSTAEEPNRSRLVLSRDLGHYISLANVAPTPWNMVFYRQPLLAFLLAFIPMSLVVLLIVFYSIRIRIKNRIIAEAQVRDAAYTAHKSLIASIAHRLRNSMYLAVLNTQTLRTKYGSSLETKPARMLGQIQDSLRLAAENITAFSTYEKIEQEKRSDQVDMHRLAAKVISDYDSPLQEKHIDVELRAVGPVVVAANEQHCYLILEGLLKNSIEAFDGQKEGKIDISISAMSDRIKIRYQDNGPGMTPEVLRELGRNIVSTKPTTGLGIGVLSIFEVCKVYNGTITYDSVPGRGVVVTLALPGAEQGGK
jgi:signal transduction histidine kinase